VDQAKNSWSVLILIVTLLTGGCFSSLDLQKVSPLNGDLKNLQPIALLPIQDFPGFPESGTNLASPVQDFLGRIGYLLVKPSEVSQVLEELDLTPQNLLADPLSLRKVKERLQAKLFLVGSILEYRLKKSFIRPQDIPIWDVWDAPGYKYQTLPTYHQGTCQITLRLSLLDPEKGSMIWTAEGTANGPSRSIPTLEKKLVEGLLGNLPSFLPKP
jgi:hypothetical protein